MITKDKWVWMPHPGHFICARDCKFHLTTRVGKYLISTVGELWSDSRVRQIKAEVHGVTIEGIGEEWDRNYFKRFGFGEIGCDRKYETMVFKAKKRKDHNDCCPWEMASGSEMDFAGYNDAGEAYCGHLKMCLKYSKKQKVKK